MDEAGKSSNEAGAGRQALASPRPSVGASALKRLYGQAYLLLTFTTLTWGGNAVASRLAVGEVSPMALTCLRWALVIMILLVVARRRVIAEWPILRARWPTIVAMGALGFTGFNALMYGAAHHTSAVNITIIQGAIPVMVLLGALVVFGTRIRIVQLMGMVTTLAGVGAIAAQGDIETLRALEFNPGDVMMVVACCFYAGYTLALRDRPKVSGLVFFSAMAGVAFLTSLPLLAYEVVTGSVVWPSPTGWLILLYVALLPSLFSQIFFMRGVELIGPGRAGLFVNLVPVFGALLAVLILSEPFHLYHAAALVLVLGGIWLAERRRA